MEKKDYLFNSAINSKVEYTLINSSFFNALSFDHKGRFSFNDKAIKSMSFLSIGLSSKTLGNKSEYFSIEIKPINKANSHLKEINSFSEIFVFSIISSRYLFISSSANSGEIRTRDLLRINFFVKESFQKNVNKIFVSATIARDINNRNNQMNHNVPCLLGKGITKIKKDTNINVFSYSFISSPYTKPLFFSSSNLFFLEDFWSFTDQSIISSSCDKSEISLEINLFKSTFDCFICLSTDSGRFIVTLPICSSNLSLERFCLNNLLPSSFGLDYNEYMNSELAVC